MEDLGLFLMLAFVLGCVGAVMAFANILTWIAG